jgi:DNA-binding MarR family transcriptional regulator
MPRSRKTRSPAAAGGAVPSGPVLDLNEHIPTRVAIFANRLSRAASRFYRKHYGIGVVEWRLIMYVGRASETRANRICRETDLDKGAVSRGLAALQGMGIVSVKEDGVDSRRNNVALTAKGRALHAELVPIALERQVKLVEGLTPDEVRLFTGLIETMQATVSGGEPGGDAPVPTLRLLVRPPLKSAARRDELPRRRASARRG